MVRRELALRVLTAVSAGFALAQAGVGCAGRSERLIDEDEAGNGGSNPGTGGSATTGGSVTTGGSTTGTGGSTGGQGTGGSANDGSGGNAATSGQGGAAYCTTFGDYAGVDNVATGHIASESCSMTEQRCVLSTELSPVVCNPDGGVPEPGTDAGARPGGDVPGGAVWCPHVNEICSSWDSCCRATVAGPQIRNDPSGQTLCCYLIKELSLKEGRPFVVNGSTRLPATKERRGATSERRSRRAALHRNPVAVIVTVRHPEMQAVSGVGNAWLETARAEHASIAAFSMLAQELMAVAAPGELVADALRAARDEIVHAELAFGLASRFLGQTLRAGALDVSGAKPSADLADIAARAAWEGCIVETANAALACEQAARATDPEVRAVLERIAADETRHAELSFRIVAYAYAIGDERVRSAVRAVLEGANALEGVNVPTAVRDPADAARPTSNPPQDSSNDPTPIDAYGQLSEAAMERIKRRALHDVIAPAIRTLLAFDPRAPMHHTASAP